MSVVIRMKRTGRRNRPCYRITVADSRWPRDGRNLETLGLYDPIAPKEERQVTLDVERARHWISVGAQPSETARSIFQRMGVFAGLNRGPAKKRDRSGRKKQTATKSRRKAVESVRETRKAGRRKERVAAKRAAAAPAGA
jgi:small subunit ribosomal protein S16